MILVKAPKDFIGDQIAQELRDAGYDVDERTGVVLAGDGKHLEIRARTDSGAEVDEDSLPASISKIEGVVKAHKPSVPTPPDEDPDVIELRRLRDKEGDLTPREVMGGLRAMLKGKRP